MSQKADEVFRDLQRRILADELSSGDRLPPERELAVNYGATRNTLREAIRRLEQVSLVTVRQGRGVTVCDYRRNGGLAILVPYLEHGTNLAEKVQVLVDLLPARIQAFNYAVEIAAERAEPADLRRIERITHGLLDAFDAGARIALAYGFAEWLEALVDAAHSLPARWIANPFLELNHSLMERFPGLWVLDPGFPDYLRRCLRALIDRDTALWRQANSDYYDRIDAVILESLGQLIPGGRPAADEPAPAELSTALNGEEH